MEHYVEKKGNVWIPRQEPINGRNIGHKVVCERLGAYEASEMTPGAVIEMKRACGGKTAAEIEALVKAESEGCNHCTHKLQSDAWKYYTYPCSECRRRTKDYFEAAEAALAAKGERE